MPRMWARYAACANKFHPRTLLAITVATKTGRIYFEYGRVMSMRSVSEVAQQMEVSPERVRQWIAAGSLPAVRVGGRWVVENGEARRHPEGRPWSEAAAWGLVCLALDRPAPWSSVKQRQRARLRLAEGLGGHVDRLSSRAVSRSFRGHQSALRRLDADARVVAGGLSGAGDVAADLVVVDRSEVYVRSGDVAVLVAEYGLEPSPMGKGNVVLRVMSEVWPFEDGEQVAPALVVALDLLESSDERTERAGRLLFGRVLREVSP